MEPLLPVQLSCLVAAAVSLAGGELGVSAVLAPSLSVRGIGT